MDHDTLEGLTARSSVVGLGRVQGRAFGHGGSRGVDAGSRGPGADASSTVQFSLSALADGTTRFSLIDASGAERVLVAALGAAREALSLEMIGRERGAFSIALQSLAIDGRSVDGLDGLGFGSLHKGPGGDAMLLEGLDFDSGFELTGVLEVRNMRGLGRSDWRNAPVLQVAAVDLMERDAGTPIPLPTPGMLTVTGLTALAALRRRR
ncbi:MAG: hypothetical protein ACF8QF_13565 [Phycisphaerales bacterium]